jgi:hypothetical protein
MKTFEKRIIERIVRVYQVEAENEDQAQEYFESQSDAEVDSWPIDAEEPDGWLEVKLPRHRTEIL